MSAKMIKLHKTSVDATIQQMEELAPDALVVYWRKGGQFGIASSDLKMSEIIGALSIAIYQLQSGDAE